MTSPVDVARFHAEYDHHADDRIRLFGALADLVTQNASVLYPGSYVDIAPSVWFDDVTYVDNDRRCPRFFGQLDAVRALVAAKRARLRVGVATGAANISFVPADYHDPLPVADASIDLLVSMYAGFISEPARRYVKPGGLLLANNSHGDASMASLDPRWTLVGVLTSRNGDYRLRTDRLDRYLVTKRGTPPTIDELRASNRGVAYTVSPAAYVFALG